MADDKQPIEDYTEALNQAFDELEAAPSEEDSISEPVSKDTPAESKETKKGRERDDSGRFKAKEKKGEVESGPEEAPTEVLQVPQPEPQLPPLIAPFDLSAEAKKDFQEWPRAVQEKFLQRYTEWSDHRDQQKAELDRGFQEVHDIKSTADRYREQWALDGVTVPQAIEHFANLNNFMKRDPAGCLRWLAEQNGVDLGQIHAAAPKQHPELLSLRQEIEALRQEREQEQAYQQQVYIQSLEREVESFAKEVDSSGQALRPYFDQIYPHMLPIVGALKQQKPNAHPRIILQEAYDQATWANPDVRAALLKAEEAKRMNEDRQKAVAAKRAGSSINGAPGGSLAPAKHKGYEDAIAAAMDEMGIH